MSDDTSVILKEILKWVRIQWLEILREKIKRLKLFSDEKDIIVYDNSDGKRSSRELSKLVGVSHPTVISLWKKWIDAGIAEPSERYGGSQCRRIFDLTELGFEMPKK